MFKTYFLYDTSECCDIVMLGKTTKNINFHHKLALKGLIDQVESIKAVEANFDLFSLLLAGQSGVERQFLLVSARREDTVSLAPRSLQSEGPLVPGTADTETPVRQDLDVSQVERTAGVRTPRGRGWEWEEIITQ